MEADSSAPLIWATSWAGMSLFFLIIVCFQYDTVLSVYAKDCNPNGNQCLFIPLEGVGIFTAGYVANGELVPGAQLGTNRVLWSDLKTDTICIKGSFAYDHYALPLELCQENAKGEISFVVPSTIRQLQLDMQLAIGTSVLGTLSCLTFLFLDSQKLAITAIGMSTTAVLAASHGIFMLLRWKGTKLYTSDDGFYVPSWSLDDHSIVIQRFRLHLNNPQFQLLIISPIGFAIGSIGMLWSALQRRRIRSYVALRGSDFV